jgi:hypothetical protein
VQGSLSSTEIPIISFDRLVHEMAFRASDLHIVRSIKFFIRIKRPWPAAFKRADGVYLLDHIAALVPPTTQPSPQQHELREQSRIATRDKRVRT